MEVKRSVRRLEQISLKLFSQLHNNNKQQADKEDLVKEKGSKMFQGAGMTIKLKFW